jgi:hypothetical protein
MLNIRPLIATLAIAAALSPAAYAAFSDKTFTVSNTGDGPLTVVVASPPISGNPTEFSLIGNNCTTVAAGSSCALTVRFTPTGSGTRTPGALNFTTNGTNGGAHSIALAGTGGSNCTAPKQVFSYTGADQYTSVPAGCSTATIKAWGAGAWGSGSSSSSPVYTGGAGGFAQRTVGGLSAGSQITVVVGQTRGSIYGGGGAMASGDASKDSGSDGAGFAGVFYGAKSQANALAIAGGGGGAKVGQSGGAGGGLAGVSAGGGGGTQTSGGAGWGTGVAGSALQGGAGDPLDQDLGASGGGGGYWGGGGAYGGAGGGSGYAPGGTLIAGSGCSVANSGDPDYVAGVGNGGCANRTAGQPGRVVIIWQ